MDWKKRLGSFVSFWMLWTSFQMSLQVNFIFKNHLITTKIFILKNHLEFSEKLFLLKLLTTFWNFWHFRSLKFNEISMNILWKAWSIPIPIIFFPFSSKIKNSPKPIEFHRQVSLNFLFGSEIDKIIGEIQFLFQMWEFKDQMIHKSRRPKLSIWRNCKIENVTYAFTPKYWGFSGFFLIFSLISSSFNSSACKIVF